MTVEGYRRRLYVIEWTVELMRRNGLGQETCLAIQHHCSEVLDSDFHGVERPEASNEDARNAQEYFDRQFASLSRGPNGVAAECFA